MVKELIHVKMETLLVVNLSKTNSLEKVLLNIKIIIKKQYVMETLLMDNQMDNARFAIKMMILFKVLSKIIIFNLDLIFQVIILNIMVNLAINNLMAKENLFLTKFSLKVNFKTIF